MIRTGNPLRFDPATVFFSLPLGQAREISARVAAVVLTQASGGRELLDRTGNDLLRDALAHEFPHLSAKAWCVPPATLAAISPLPSRTCRVACTVPPADANVRATCTKKPIRFMCNVASPCRPVLTTDSRGSRRFSSRVSSGGRTRTSRCSLCHEHGAGPAAAPVALV